MFSSGFPKTLANLLPQHANHDPASPLLKASNVNVHFESGTALEDISFSLCQGQRVALVGPNGAGKTTLLKLIAGVEKPSSGEINIFGSQPGHHICIAYVPQRSQVDWNFPVTLQEVVMMGRTSQIGFFRTPKPLDHQAVKEAIHIVGLTHLAKRQISQLSGGQQQRMFIARALAQQAELILMDEPLTGLDMNSMEEIFTLFDHLKENRVTLLVSLHDLKLAALHFEHIMLLNTRMIAFSSPDEVFTHQNLLAAYGSHLHLVETEDGTLALGDSCCEGNPELA